MAFNPAITARPGLGNSVGPPLIRRPDSIFLPNSPIVSAWKTSEAPYAGTRSKMSAAQRAGLAYQKRVGKFLQPLAVGAWVVSSGPWFVYCCGSGPRRYCQPDFLLLDATNRTMVVVEVKIRWTDIAWWQLRKLYLPVLEVVFPEWTFITLCITRSYDPAVSIPEPVNLCSDLFDSRPDAFNLLVHR